MFYVGQVMSPHHSDQMSQRSQVSLSLSLSCLKGHMSLGVLFGSVFQQCVVGREVGR